MENLPAEIESRPSAKWHSGRCFEATASPLLIDTLLMLIQLAVSHGKRSCLDLEIKPFRGRLRQNKSYTDDSTPYVDHFVPSGKKDDLYAGLRNSAMNSLTI